MHDPLAFDTSRYFFEARFRVGAFAATSEFYLAIVADFAFASKQRYAALFLCRLAAPNTRLVKKTTITHVILPTFEEVCHAQHGAMHSCFW